jgi:hypothetical protein
MMSCRGPEPSAPDEPNPGPVTTDRHPAAESTIDSPEAGEPAVVALDTCRQRFSWIPQVSSATETVIPAGWNYDAQHTFNAARDPFVNRGILELEAALHQGTAAVSAQRAAPLQPADDTVEVWVLSGLGSCQLTQLTWSPSDRGWPPGHRAVTWTLLPEDCPGPVDLDPPPPRSDGRAIWGAFGRGELCVEPKPEGVEAAMRVDFHWVDEGAYSRALVLSTGEEFAIKW